MSNIEIKNAEGKTVDTVEFSSDVFGIEPNIAVTHQVVVCQASNQRQGTHSTKNRAAVSGGGVVFGPTPHSHAKKVNNKEVKLAMRSVLSGKLRDAELTLVDSFSFEKPSTKQAVALLAALGVEGKRVTVVVADDDINAFLSFRNIKKVNVIGSTEANAGNLIDNGALVMSVAVAKQLEEALA